jgi:hypothetical protein
MSSAEAFSSMTAFFFSFAMESTSSLFWRSIQQNISVNAMLCASPENAECPLLPKMGEKRAIVVFGLKSQQMAE